MFRWIAVLCAALVLPGCGGRAPGQEAKVEAREIPAGGIIALTPQQIAAAGIALVQPQVGGPGSTIESPALLESDPQSMRIVAAPVEGRIVALTGNLGSQVAQGQALAVMESREAASLQAEVERARSRFNLARANLRRDEALYARGFRPLREVEVSRAAAEVANTELRLAQQQVSAAGIRGGSLNRILIVSPIAGTVIARNAVLGQTFTPDNTGAELFRVANLSRIAVTLSLSPADAAGVRVGDDIEVIAGTRRQHSRVRFVSPALDPSTRLVQVIAELDNRAGQWRIGEPVQARIRVAATAITPPPLMIPASAVQTLAARQVVFVRTSTGFRATPVTLGSRAGPMVAVTQGLSGGEVIAAENSFVLKAELGRGEAGHDED